MTISGHLLKRLSILRQATGRNLPIYQISELDRSFLKGKYKKQFKDVIFFRQTFNWLDSNGDSEVSIEKFNNDWPFSIDFDEFSAKYLPIFDTDNSGTLNFEESMYYFGAIADGAARLWIKVRQLIYF